MDHCTIAADGSGNVCLLVMTISHAKSLTDHLGAGVHGSKEACIG